MNLQQKSYALRARVLDMVYRAKTGHIGGDFSVCDILNVLYNRVMDVTPENFSTVDHDHFILSKATRWRRCTFFPEEDLLSFSQFGSKYIGHPNNKVAGIEMNSGSLGHGLSVGVGMALVGKRQGKSYRVYVVMGDGELAEGSVWEGAMAAGHYQLDNLCAVVDRNRLQISGGTEEVMSQDSQDDRWAAFGWHTRPRQGQRRGGLGAGFQPGQGLPGQAHGDHRRHGEGLRGDLYGGQSGVASQGAHSGRI